MHLDGTGGLAYLGGPNHAQVDHLPVLEAMWRVPLPPAGADPEAVARLRAQVRRLRGANAQVQLPDAEAWDALVDGVEALRPAVPSSSAL